VLGEEYNSPAYRVQLNEAVVVSNVQVMMMMMISFIGSPKTCLIWVVLLAQLTADNVVRCFETSVCSSVNSNTCSADILNIAGHLASVSPFLWLRTQLLTNVTT
jgi:hypothetical protein